MPQFQLRRRGPLVPTLIILAVIVLAVTLAATVWTDVLWFDSVGFTKVFWVENLTKAGLFVVCGLITAAVVASSLLIGYRTRPVYPPVSEEQQNLDHYRELLEPLRKLATIAAPAILGLFAGSAGASQWQTFLLWVNRVPFGSKDAQYNMDIGFFVFTLPWLRFIVGFLTMVLLLGVLAAAVTHYVYGGLQLQTKGERTTKAARIHLSLLLAALVLVRAGSWWLDRYSLTTKDSRLITGLTYTDQHAVMPTKAILAVAAVMCAALFVATIWTHSWRLPVVGVIALAVVAIVAGGIYPAMVQSFKVKPSEQSLEAPFIDRNIKATRTAYGLDAAKVTEYKALTTPSRGQLRNDTTSIPGIRLVDPSVVSPTFKQLQAVKNYYQFPDALDVDRYTIDGKTRDTVVAVRELDLEGLQASQRNWVNDHTVFTHGFGLVAAYGNRSGEDGQPVFYQQNIPPVGPLGAFEPRIYFGESSPAYSIAGGPAAGPKRELDYPNSSATGQANNTYAGKGGVNIGNFFRKAAYALKYRELKIMLSDTVNADSRLLDHRTPRERVERVAPWLTLDGNSYPAVVDGRVQWIVDGYTTSANYPYSRMQQIDSATTDSLTARTTSVQALQAGQVNYIRNSVKATVDAFDGSVKLYAWDEKDPLLKAWSKAFGGTVRPLSAISSDQMSHLRYPEDLFKVQRSLMTKYHVTDPGAFYGGQDYWAVPDDPTQEQKTVDQPPYYLSIAMPGVTSPSFSLTTTFKPQGDRPVLSGFMAVDANAGNVAGKKRAGYGALRLLELPKDTTVKGPGQVQNDIESSNTTSSRFTLTLSQFLNNNRTQGSQVTLGNQLTLPVGGGLLYVEPIYVSAKTGSSFPLARAIVVAFGNQLAWSDTLSGALDGLFGGSSGADTGDSPTPAKTTTPVPGAKGTGTAAPSAALKAALADVQKAFTDGQEALKVGDFTAYGAAQKRLQAAIADAVAAAPSGSVTLPAPTATGTAPVPTPKPTATR
ncbi:MAG: UPF0182 family protein [Dermatophilaceae bacterium]|nr:UPF0182 family protein [Dermatophilaceae bacterium]